MRGNARPASALGLVLALTLLPLAAGCALAEDAGSARQARAVSSALGERATAAFWGAFRDARYEAIPEVHTLLAAAYDENPHDPRVAMLLGQLHFWKAAERARDTRRAPTIAEHLILAERYLHEAARLAPDDHRIPGWVGGLELALGNVHGDPGLTRRGYFRLRKAMLAYPEFNGFSFAFPLISQPPASPLLREAVDAMWETAELCNRERYDRARPHLEYRRFAQHRTAAGRTRVCWNTELVPHNMEGFFLHFGDLLLKAGFEEAARAAWDVIPQIPEYATWRYQAALEDRRTHFARWSRTLRDDDPDNDPPYMLRSPLSCTGCHAS
jgi:hypothetical protein